MRRSRRWWHSEGRSLLFGAMDVDTLRQWRATRLYFMAHYQGRAKRETRYTLDQQLAWINYLLAEKQKASTKAGPVRSTSKRR